MNKRELINSIKDILALDDYKAISTGAGAVSLVKGNNKIIFGYNKYPKIYVLGPQILCYKTFSEIENILEPYYKKYNLGYQPYTIHTSSRRFEQLSLIDLITHDDIHQVSTELKTMVYEDILPFFDENDTLEKVHNHYLTLSDDELSSYFVGELHLRIMVIKAILKVPDFENYSLETLESYKRESEGDYSYIFAPIYAFLPELFDELKNL